MKARCDRLSPVKSGRFPCASVCVYLASVDAVRSDRVNPPEAGAFKGLEQEVDTYRTQFNLITEALNVKKVRCGLGGASQAARQSTPLQVERRGGTAGGPGG